MYSKTKVSCKYVKTATRTCLQCYRTHMRFTYTLRGTDLRPSKSVRLTINIIINDFVLVSARPGDFRVFIDGCNSYHLVGKLLLLSPHVWHL